ncbi:vacuolar sorting protein VPS1 [Truncatella angustata]|uniref:Vacuolar sorting protein VPS1 n=1 Tax=Truncatella angustata TaxID=152316 RepID=A0A9P8ZW27_9PEZI|nr:vacuolar sorting protein VPS1 [Truncatella angustata]KAH6652547.1 vacuolar sorting protein VPS1 [Truncatella angustata]
MSAPGNYPIESGEPVGQTEGGVPYEHDSAYEDLPEEALTENPFDTESSRILFNAIDQLQSCDAGQDIDIPQLVIVGGQSTGKSSLLQSLVDIPFPTGQGCCTRFATRIVSRRTPPGSKNECVITIVKPDFDIKDYYSLNEHFNYDIRPNHHTFRYQSETLSAQDFLHVMKEVEEKYMGIKSGKRRGAKNFATEVLKVELSGPKRSHFSILDIPGVFATPVDVNVEEMEGVRRMVIEYLRKPQNLVICVADAGSDLANQGVFTLAAEHVQKSRLIGVFTKCDNLKESGDVSSMQHGWFVVRNRRGDEGISFDLNAAERDLFDSSPWAAIPKTRRGSRMLKKFLGDILCSRIRQEFPSLQQKVRDLLKETLAARKSLGDPRPTHHHRVQYLVDIVQKFQRAAQQALDSPGRLPSKEMRVRGIVAAKNRNFDDEMRDQGHYYEFEEKKPQKNPNVLESLPFNTEGVSDIRQEIREQIEIFRSSGLPGLLNIDVFPVLYKIQTQKWLDMATDHLHDVANDTILAATSILTLLNQEYHLCPNARDGFVEIIQDFHRSAHDKAEKLLIDYMVKEKEFPLQTTNPVFEDRIEGLRTMRIQEATRDHKKAMELWIEKKLKKDKLTTPAVMEMVDHVLTFLHYNADTRMENEVHDVLRVYYELALQSFIDFTTKRIIEDFVSSKTGPLLGLSTDYVLNLSETEVEKLAREDDSVLSKRDKYDEKIARLEQSYAIAERAWKQTTPH